MYQLEFIDEQSGKKLRNERFKNKDEFERMKTVFEEENEEMTVIDSNKNVLNAVYVRKEAVEKNGRFICRVYFSVTSSLHLI
ncbi:phosphoribosyl-AMP cyclohydrolase [Alkalibacillus flavidus]|uniref:Phosphoribosyl-AMP cyclohydrolase n=1 Tax=Alkalibacillus flavidus TaxID=546021 RepID=A0ABV2KXU6_9BACI